MRLASRRTRYSNFGFELLGHAIANRAGMTYADLVQDRLAAPLELGSFYVPATPDQLRPAALLGTSRAGRARQPWTGEALGPAGGIRSSIVDMRRLAQALLDGSAPGSGGLDPVTTFGVRHARIGAAWITIDVKVIQSPGTTAVRAVSQLDRVGAHPGSRRRRHVGHLGLGG